MKPLFFLLTIFSISICNAQSVGVGTSTPDASAVMELQSTAQGFLPPRMALVQMIAIASPAEGLIVYCTNCIPVGLYVFDSTNWVSLSDGSTSNTVVSAGGRVWMDRNLGASQVATSSTDTNAYGDLYQWGRAADGHEIRTSGTTTTNATSDMPGHDSFIVEANSPWDWRVPQNDNLWQGVNGTNNPCPTGFRLPTEAEWNTERTSWSSNDAAGAFNSPLKLSLAGYRHHGSGNLVIVGVDGYYWSNTVNGTIAGYFFLNTSNAGMDNSNRANGISVRCIQD